MKAFEQLIDDLEDNIRAATLARIIVAGDFNAKSPVWRSRSTDRKGSHLAEMVASLGYTALNEGISNTFRRGMTGTIIDVTFASPGLSRYTSDCKVLEDYTLSDHQYIEFKIALTCGKEPFTKPSQARGWILRKLDEGAFKKTLTAKSQTGKLAQLADSGNPEEKLEGRCKELKGRRTPHKLN